MSRFRISCGIGATSAGRCGRLRVRDVDGRRQERTPDVGRASGSCLVSGRMAELPGRSTNPRHHP